MCVLIFLLSFDCICLKERAFFLFFVAVYVFGSNRSLLYYFTRGYYCCLLMVYGDLLHVLFVAICDVAQ